MKLLSILLSLQLLILPVYAYADKSQPINKGTPAPYSGLLLDSEAIAKILAEKEYQKHKCEVDTKYATDKQKLECERITGKLQVELEVAKKKYTEVNKIKDDEIKRLQDIVAKQSNISNKNIWWMVAGIVIGVGTAIGIGFAVAEMK